MLGVAILSRRLERTFSGSKARPRAERTLEDLPSLSAAKCVAARGAHRLPALYLQWTGQRPAARRALELCTDRTALSGTLWATARRCTSARRSFGRESWGGSFSQSTPVSRIGQGVALKVIGSSEAGEWLLLQWGDWLVVFSAGCESWRAIISLSKFKAGIGAPSSRVGRTCGGILL